MLTYNDRWPTETFNEDVKGHLGVKRQLEVDIDDN
jgi:hypothetical protein